MLLAVLGVKSGPPKLGQKLWLKADAGITQSGGLITSWADQSGNGNDASSSSVARPTFNASSINGLPGVTFGPNGVQMGSSNTLILSLAAREVFIVCQMANVASNLAFCFRRGTTVAALGWESPSSNFVYTDGLVNNATVPTGPVINTPYLLDWSFDGVSGDKYTFSHNSIAETVTGIANSENGTAGYVIATTPPAFTSSFKGDICEILVYDHVLTTTDRNAVLAYVEAKYGIALGQP